MSTIGSQTIKGTIYSYLGILIGFFSVTLLRSHGLTTEQNGILEVINSYAMILAQLGSLGFLNACIRCFPYFKNPENNHNGFLFLVLAVPFTGTLFFILLYGIIYFLFPEFGYLDFLKEYKWPILILTLSSILFNSFDTYNRTALLNSVTGSILKEFVQKLAVAITMGLMLFLTLPFNTFLTIWLIANAIPAIIIVSKLKKENQINLKPNFKFLNKQIINMLSSVSLFALLSGFTTMIIQNIDKIMINEMIDASVTGIYGITAFFGAVVMMPSRIMYRIGGVIVADKWKNNDLNAIQSIYKKSCDNQLLIGLLIFIGIWANIHNVFHMLPPEYEAGKYVIFFISLGGLIEMSTGLNGMILATSKYYRYDTYFFIGLIALTIITNYWFIPIYGITGAAIAYALTVLLFNLFRFAFLWFKFNLQPFTKSTIFIAVTGTIILYLISFFPVIKWFPIDIAIRSAIITICYVGIIYFFKLSPEMNGVIHNTLEKVMAKLKK